MPHVTSADGTTIGYDRLSDDGPALVLVGGGLDDGAENVSLGEHLAAAGFAVVNYRRRGRGDSGDTEPYAVEREVEDLAAVIDATAAGGRPHLFGASSGAALALEAAAAGLPAERIAVHEVPYLLGDEMTAAWRHYVADLDAALGRGDRDEALRRFMRLAGSSEEDIAGAEAAPVWPALRELAPTLRYDAACLGDGPPPADRLAKVAQPVLPDRRDGGPALGRAAGRHLRRGRRRRGGRAARCPAAHRRGRRPRRRPGRVLGPKLAEFYRPAA
ncbi:alpha/beta fold hydrolase [Jiangella ureilytica]|uniref:alpha/beta fold hydrolase n=1 Tax=Jiangella ureilytica TaxID=2530374 RepID=UPI00193D6D27|nr:alpha/beta fold hydrolase [Jiangella ureilytica]